MKILNITSPEITHHEFQGKLIGILKQSWVTKTTFYGYKKTPRPYCGLLFILEDIKVSIYQQSQPTLHAQKGDVVFIPKNCCYWISFHDFTNKRLETNYTLHFELFDKKTNEEILFTEKPTILTNDTYDHIRSALNLLWSKSQLNEGFCNQLTLDSHFFVCLSEIILTEQNKKSHKSPIADGITAIEAEWNLNYPVYKYANLCNISESSFFITFRKTLGCSPIQYRNQIRLSKAKALLSSTNYSIEKIAQTTGFQNPLYFNKFFKKNTNLSPSSYRRTTQTI